MSRAAFAELIGSSAAVIDRLVHGDRAMFSLALALAIQTETGIPIAEWQKPPTERYLRALRAALKAA